MCVPCKAPSFCCITSSHCFMSSKVWQVGQMRVCAQGEYLCPECTAGTRNIGADMFAHVKPGCKHTARECFLSGSGHLHMGEILRLQRSKSKSDTYRMCVRRYEAPRDPALPLSNRGKVLFCTSVQLIKHNPRWGATCTACNYTHVSVLLECLLTELC